MADDDTNELESFYDVADAFLVLMEPYGHNDAITILTLVLGSIVVESCTHKKQAEEILDIIKRNLTTTIDEAANEGGFFLPGEAIQ